MMVSHARAGTPVFSFRPLVGALVLAFPLSAAMAQTTSQLREVVVSASGFEQEVKDAPASITVITREELETKRITNIADALADVEGIDTGGSAGKTGGLNIRMRGLGDEYTLVLIDGRRQNSTGNIYPNGFGETRNSFLPPVSAIERIEVIRGPMSTLYGSDAMGGVVNIITRKVSNEWMGSVTVEGTKVGDSAFGSSYSGEVYLSGPIKQDLLGLQIRARNWHREQSNIRYEFDDGSQSDELSMGRNPTKGRNENYGARLTLTPNSDHDVWVDFETSTQSYDNRDGQLGTLGVAGGYGPRQVYSRDKILLAHDWRMANGVLESSLSYVKSGTQGRLIPLRLVGRSGDRDLKSEDLIFDTKYVTALGNHMLTVGGQYWDAKMEDGVLPSPNKFTQVGIFVENEWRMRENLALTLGLRHDNHDEFGSFTTPRAYVVWNTNEHWTLKGGVGKGYKAPRLEQLTPGIQGVGGQGRNPLLGNPDLKPETSLNTEIGAIFDTLNGFTAGATLFRNKYKDFIASGPTILACDTDINEAECEAFLASVGSPWDMGYRNYPNPGGVPDRFNLSRSVNVDEARIQGLELFTRWAFAPNWSTSFNYTFTKSEELSGANKGRPINDTPEHMVNLALHWKPTDRLNTWVRGEYRSEGYRSGDIQGTTTASRDVVGDFKAYSLVHVGASFKATDSLTLSGTIYNLLDKEFNTAKVVNGTAYPEYRNNQEPRRLWVSATMNF